MDEESLTNTDDGENSSDAASPKIDVSTHLKKCITMLKGATSDTEKFAALLMVTKLVKADHLDDASQQDLIDAIGLGFLGRLLSTNDAPEGCPPYMFKSIALTVLSCFISCCHGNSALYKLIPLLAEIISKPDLYEEDLTLFKDAHECLLSISSTAQGRKALVDYEVIGTLVDAVIGENIYYEQALSMLRLIACDPNSKMWEDEPEAFDKLIVYLCTDFAVNENEQKFVLCDILSDIILTMPSEALNSNNDAIWKPYLHQGLSNILFSKLNQDLRNKGLHLASSVLEALGVSWIVSCSDKGRQLFLLMVHLSCIEVRMSLEDRTFNEAVTSALQTTACYSIIEHSIKFLVNGAFDLEDKQKQQLYSALKGAFNGVLVFLNGASDEETLPNDLKSQMFISASIRVLGAWLAEETSANKDEIYQILPFLIKISNNNFKYNLSILQVKKVKKKQSYKSEKKEALPDLLRFLLPGLCHLTAEDTPRHILLDVGIENFLFEYFNVQWSLLALNDKEEFEDALHRSSDMLITICNILMNIVVQEPQRVKSDIEYFRLLQVIFTKISEIPVNNQHLQLVGSLCTLGLMILRHRCNNVQREQFSAFRFIQATVRFLWDAYNVEESPDYATLTVSAAYKPYWNDLLELWFLSIHTLTLLLPHLPWICDFLIESEWPQTIADTLLLVRSGGIDKGLKNAFEDFLCMLVKTSKASKDLLIIKGIETVCKNLNFDKLIKVL